MNPTALFALIVAAGILSRLIALGHPFWDKYLGDALYAAMVYTLLRFATTANRAATFSALLLTAIETFQLTGLPAQLLQSAHLSVRLIARLIGTQFSVLDLLAYAIGLITIHLLQPGKYSKT